MNKISTKDVSNQPGSQFPQNRYKVTIISAVLCGLFIRADFFKESSSEDSSEDEKHDSSDEDQQAMLPASKYTCNKQTSKTKPKTLPPL